MVCVCLNGDSEQQKQNKRLNKDASNVFLLKIETNTWYCCWPSNRFHNNHMLHHRGGRERKWESKKSEKDKNTNNNLAFLVLLANDVLWRNIF